jgi:hypothetical protein
MERVGERWMGKGEGGGRVSTWPCVGTQEFPHKREVGDGGEMREREREPELREPSPRQRVRRHWEDSRKAVAHEWPRARTGPWAESAPPAAPRRIGAPRDRHSVRPESLLASCAPPPRPAALLSPFEPRRARAAWAEPGARPGAGRGPSQLPPPPPRPPQTFTKPRVRPHQSALIIVGWAAGGGRGPGPAGPLKRRGARGAGAGSGGGRREQVKRNLRKMDESGGRHPQPARPPPPSL